jgi:hypothetical protein
VPLVHGTDTLATIAAAAVEDFSTAKDIDDTDNNDFPSSTPALYALYVLPI